MNHTLPPGPRRKLSVLFEGVRYTEALGAAARGAFPNFHPYRFARGEHDPTGTGTATIPYLLRFGDGSVVRVRGDASSAWSVGGDPESGFVLEHRDGGVAPEPVGFEPLPTWMHGATDDGAAMAGAGLSLHGDMAVVNVAPGCQYFLKGPDAGAPARCTFCTYGRPDARTEALGQDITRTELPDRTYAHLGETLAAALDEGGIRHLYLVGGSMWDWREEGHRFVELARRVQAVVRHEVPVTCGSGALPDAALDVLYGEKLVDSACFNLEIGSEALFEKICPGKARYVGFHRWIGALESAVARWGRGHVYSAMVAGVELEPEHGMSWEAAADLALEGCENLCARGVIPVYSLYWPLGGRERPGYQSDLLAYFERLNLGTREIRRRHGLAISDRFMCHRCAYMQLECDVDRAEAGAHGT